MESVFRIAKTVYEHHSAGAAVRFIYGLQSGPAFVWVMVLAKKLECIVLRIDVDDAHDLNIVVPSSLLHSCSCLVA